MESKSTNNRHQSPFKDLDWFTLVLYLLLVACGVVSIYAASYDFDNASIFDFNEFSGKQIHWIGLSLILGFVLLLIEERMYEAYAYPIYIAIIFLLIVTIFIAPNIKGSRSWLVLGPMSVQPAEFAKFATALALAKLFGGYNFYLNAKPSNYFKALGIIFLPILLILAQHETGTALVYLGLIFVLYREGMSGLVLLAGAMTVAIFVITIKFTEPSTLDIPKGEFIVYIILTVSIVAMLAFYGKTLKTARNILIGYLCTALLVWALGCLNIHVKGSYLFLAIFVATIIYLIIDLVHSRNKRLVTVIAMIVISLGFMLSVNYVFTKVLQPHQQQRIRVSLGIENDPLRSGYNVNQSKIAIGSGGLTGKGFLMGTQTKLKYVPEQHTDFIFCTIGEEEGFIGTTGTMLLFVILILRVIHIAERQPTTFGRVYAYCVASYLIVHFCINIGMVIGLCPVIGIPLPFFSYGGSSLWGFTFLLFILLRIDASRRLHH